MPLEAINEKRDAVRYDCVAVTSWSYINQHPIYRAHILNFSGSGLYLETDLALKPGTIIWIRVDRRLSGGTADDFSDCLPTSAMVEAKWCRELPGSAESRYGIGLKFQVPMV